MSVRTCRQCGCTDERACAGGCSWVDVDLCSACLPVMGEHGLGGPGLEAVREGLCPNHGTPLERRDEYGWCAECDNGWSCEGDHYYSVLVIAPDFSKLTEQLEKARRGAKAES